ncbi:MAG: phosphotransferase [Humibacillus sp.]|nr:phosphotransferase [Humibacillus sp.]MDN5777445.1 phosphotransferase [Humibacillus sp.]
MDFSSLSGEQQTILARWLPGSIVVHDHSWGLVETQVLEVVHSGCRYIVKAAGAGDGHLSREIEAHQKWLSPWTSIGRAPVLVHHDLAAGLLVTRYLPGTLVLDSPAADEPEVYRQAGELLDRMHNQPGAIDGDYEATANEKSLWWLRQPHRIDDETVERLRAEIGSWPTPPARLVPTHGDWQPRNWLVHHDEVRVIDLGRAALRPAMSDLTRLAAQEFRRDPRLEAAFLVGYVSDPRTNEADSATAWFRTRVHEAIGTATWAHQVGDGSFEAQGHRMIAEALADPSSSG